MRTVTVLTGLALLIGAFVMCPTAGEANGRSCRDCAPPPPPIHVILKVCHPCTGCEHEVEVCIPPCCTDAPCVSHQHTLIGHGRTVYEWTCGHRVIIRFSSCGYRVIQRG